MKQLLKDYPIGSDVTLMNAFYQYPVKMDNGKWMEDFICLIYKDNVTGKKGHEFIFKPDYTYYITKDGEAIPDHNMFFIDKDKVEPVTVRYRNLEKDIAERTGNIDFYKENLRDGNRAGNKKLHYITNVFMSDMNIEDHYRYHFSRQYTNNVSKLHKEYYDIECDTINMAGDFVESGECPINMVSMLDDEVHAVFSFILRNPKNPLIQEFEDSILNGKLTEKDISDFVIKNVGGWKQAKRIDVYDLKYKMYFFDEEIDLIKQFFRTVHYLDPDFIEGWNSSAFDLQYFIDRIWALGYDPGEVMCNPEWEVKVVKNFIDQRVINEPAERGDFAVISGNPVWLDQYIQFASRRKAKIGSFTSFKLDDIAKSVAKIRKLDYHHITRDIAQLPYLDFKTFALYNIMDVICNQGIEYKSNDIEYLFTKCLVNNTSYRKGHRQTVYLVNRMTSDFEKAGFIIGNNVNRQNPPPTEKFEGAIVHDPLRNGDYSKIKIDGRPIMVCDNLQDYDYKSLYPSIDIEFNIAPNTQIGKVVIDHKVYDHENTYNKEKYNRGGEFMDNFTVDNHIEFCKRWLHLAGINEFLIDMKEYIEKNVVYGSSLNNFENYRVNALYDIKGGKERELEPYRHAIICFDTLEDNGIESDYRKLVESNGND